MGNIIKIVIAMIIWGSIGVFVKNIPIQSFELAFLRALVGSIFIGIIYFINSKKEKQKETDEKENEKKGKLMLIASGVLMAINWASLFESFKYTTISNATLAYYVSPIIVVFVSPIILKEKYNVKIIISAIFAMLGLFLILNNSTATAQVLDNTKGIIFGLCSACLYATIVILNKYVQGFNDYERTFIQLFSATIVLLPFVIFRNCLEINSAKILFLVIFIGIVHTGIAYYLYFSAIKVIKAQTAALLNYIDPIATIIFSSIFLNESLYKEQIIGGSIILISTFIGQRKSKEENDTKEEKIFNEDVNGMIP